MINGILGSLVAITPACASVHTYDAFPIGVVGALVGLGINTIICRCQIDDPVGAIGVHAGAGMWGLLSVGLFADSNLVGINVMDGLFRGGGFKLLGVQLLTLTIVVTAGWALMWSASFFYIIGVCLSKDWKNPRSGLRNDPANEERGEDWHLHGVIDQEAYLADMKAKKGLGDDDESISSSESDDEFADNMLNGRGKPTTMYGRSEMYTKTNESDSEDVEDHAENVVEKTKMFMKTVFKGNFDELSTFQHDAKEELIDQDEEMKTDDTEILHTLDEVEEDEEMNLRGQSKHPKTQSDFQQYRRRRTIQVEIPEMQSTHELRRPSAVRSRSIGLNGGLGAATVTQSAMNGMSPEQIRRVRRAPRNVGVLGSSMISKQSTANESRGSRTRNMRRANMMRAAHTSSGERNLQIYR